MLGTSFVFSKGDEEWTRKRKATAHAFYKDRLALMMVVLKEKLKNLVTNWIEEIESNPKGETVIDMALVFEKLFCGNIVHISFGEDVSDILIDTDWPTEFGGTEFTRKATTLP